MKETDRSAILRMFERWDPLLHGAGNLVTIESDHEPDRQGEFIKLRFDEDGKLVDFSVRVLDADGEVIA